MILSPFVTFTFLKVLFISDLFVFLFSLEPRPEMKGDQPVDFTAVLHAAVKRIRFITEESENSDKSDNEDFD